MHCGHRQADEGESLQVQNKSMEMQQAGACVADEPYTFGSESSQAFHDLHSSPKGCLIAGVLVVQSRK